MVVSLLRWADPGAIYLLAGSTLYIVGSLLVTIVVHIPKNNALAAAQPTDLNGVRLWADYLTQWTAWNHVRAIASLIATALLIIGQSHG